MNLVLALAAILVVVFLWQIIRARARLRGGHPGVGPTGQRKDVGKALRLNMLQTRSTKVGVTPTDEFPRIYGVLMDWPLGEDTATLFSASVGAASLYTTSDFGIVGGERFESVRIAAKDFVRDADRFFDEAVPTTDFSYPTADRIRFYFLTFEGVRFIESDLAPVERGTSSYSGLFELGQKVLTELRLAVDKRE